MSCWAEDTTVAGGFCSLSYNFATNAKLINYLSDLSSVDSSPHDLGPKYRSEYLP